MKKIIYLCLVLSLSSLSKVRSQMMNEVSIELKFVDSLITENNRETGIQVRLVNKSNKDIYIPNILSPFIYQVSDSLVILKSEDGIDFTEFHTVTGRPRYQIVHNGIYSGSTSYKLNQYFKKFQSKKRVGENLTQHMQEFKGKRSPNLLFLKKDEAFILYHIVPINYLYSSVGYYKVTLNFHEKSDVDFPGQIDGYEKYEIPSMETKPIFITVENKKKVRKVLVKDSGGKQISKFDWPIYKYTEKR